MLYFAQQHVTIAKIDFASQATNIDINGPIPEREKYKTLKDFIPPTMLNHFNLIQYDSEE